MKTYEEEAKQLLDEYYKRELKIREKYKGIINDTQLDGSPETKEIEKNTKKYKEELKELKEKHKDTKE